MIGKYLTYLCDQNCPWNTSQVSHTIGTNSSIFGPNLDNPKSLLEILKLLPSQIQNQQIILPAKKWLSTGIIRYRILQQVIRNSSLNISWDSFLFKLTKTDINIDILKEKGDNRHFSILSCSQMLHLILVHQFLLKLIKKMSGSLYEIRTHTNQINITAMWPQIQNITTKRQQLSSILMYLILIDPHLMLGNIHTPLLHQLTYKFHGLILQYLLSMLLIKIILVQQLFHQFSINIITLSFNIKCFTSH